jgi:catechol 2,3-dioxygenase
VHLTVTDLDRAIAFYAGVLGLRLHLRQGARATLGDGAGDALVLVADPGAKPAGRHAGLYHVALLYPSRAELARVALRLATSGTAIEGASDHGTHEAIYLPDPDGNGVELAADRPPEQWPPLDQLMHAGGPEPLDLQGLFALVEGEAPRPHAAEGLRVGHVHLHVNDLDAATAFYRDVLGFDVTMALPHAVFLSFGGYHHHVGANVWRGRGIPGVPGDAVGMRWLTLELPEPGLGELVTSLERADVRTAPVAGGTLVHDPAVQRGVRATKEAGCDGRSCRLSRSPSRSATGTIPTPRW